MPRKTEPIRPFRESSSRGRPSLAAELNLGPKSAAWLMAAGVRSRDDIAHLGVMETCRRVHAAGQPVSVLLAYALEGALAGCQWNAIPWETKQALRTEFSKLRRESPPRLKAARRG
jgi:hypothetical protein